VEVLQRFDVDRIHVHHLQENEDYLKDLIGLMRLPFDVTLHDYYLLAPQPHLCNAQGTFVAETGPGASRQILDAVPEAQVASLEAWQARHDWLLLQADRVIAPCKDLAARYRRAIPGVAIRVAPHPERPRPESLPVKVPRLNDTEPLRVVILGMVAAHKGRQIIARCAELCDRRALPIEFHLIGFASPPYDDPPSRFLHLHGEYAAGELPGLIERTAPHLAWFPAQCPESYSYTLSEAMRANLPVLAADLGAFAERLKGRDASWLLDWQSSADEWLDMMSRIRTIFASSVASSAPAPRRPDENDAFYDEDYLAWHMGPRDLHEGRPNDAGRAAQDR
jgi:glycosyltransferase involved in cell wall biosynthesis